MIAERLKEMQMSKQKENEWDQWNEHNKTNTTKWK